jgi:hypothetical protein
MVRTDDSRSLALRILALVAWIERFDQFTKQSQGFCFSLRKEAVDDLPEKIFLVIKANQIGVLHEGKNLLGRSNPCKGQKGVP